MINTETKNNVVENLQLTMAERLDEQLKGLDLNGFMTSNNTDLVVKSVEKIQANVIASIPAGIPVPETILRVSATGSGNEITVVNVTLTSKIKAEKKFRFAKSFISDNIVTNIAAYLTEAYKELIIDIMAEDNLEVVNQVLAEAAEKAGVSYKVSMVSSIGGTAAKISEISDDEVVFFADLDKVFEIDDILAFQEASEDISQEAIDEAKNQIAESLEESQTTVELVSNRGGLLISLLANINRGTKAMTMLKQVTNRNAENINTDKDLTAYYLKDNVFALVAQKDGECQVILSPFDVETLRKVDVDVLKEIGK